MERFRLAQGEFLDARMSKRAWVAVVALLAVGSVAQAATRSVDKRQTHVDAQACGVVPARLVAAAARIVGADWPRYRPFMCLYPVRAPDGNEPLYLLALDVARADRAHALAWRHGEPVSPDDVSGNIDPIPLPAVIDRDGRLIATLPRAFPNDPPATMSVIFSDWRGDFPSRIALRIDDPTQDVAAKPPYCPPPLVWNKAAGRFIESPGDFYVSCPRR